MTLLTEVEAAEILKIKPGTLAAWRVRGEGPPYLKIGALVRYDGDALEKSLRSNTVTPGKKKPRRRKPSRQKFQNRH
jgi:hypothetical protein